MKQLKQLSATCFFLSASSWAKAFTYMRRSTRQSEIIPFFKVVSESVSNSAFAGSAFLSIQSENFA